MEWSNKIIGSAEDASDMRRKFGTAGMNLATQVDELRTGGSRVETVFPDARAGDVFNANASDPSTRLPAARGGYDQGRDLAGQLTEFWCSRPLNRSTWSV